MRFIDDTATITCRSGYGPVDPSHLRIICGARYREVGRPEVEWQYSSTGQRAGLVCVPDGFEAKEHVTVSGVLTMHFNFTNGRSLRGGMCGDADFNNSVAFAIAVGLTTLLETTVPIEDITELSLGACAGRRLAERTSISYTSQVSSQRTALYLEQQFNNPTMDALFVNAFTTTLEANADVIVFDVQTSPPIMAVTYTTVLIPVNATVPNATAPPPQVEDRPLFELWQILVGANILLVICCATVAVTVTLCRRTRKITPSTEDEEEKDEEEPYTPGGTYSDVGGYRPGLPELRDAACPPKKEFFAPTVGYFPAIHDLPVPKLTDADYSPATQSARAVAVANR